jgi:hypothetical protein
MCDELIKWGEFSNLGFRVSVPKFSNLGFRVPKFSNFVLVTNEPF